MSAQAVLIALGSNQPGRAGSPLAMLQQAAEDLLQAGLGPLVASRVYRTAAVAETPQPDYLNACLMGRSEAEPRALLDRLLTVEGALGRRRSFRNAPRSIDIDLLALGDCIRPDLASWCAVAEGVTEGQGLLLPHPRLHQRRFVLAPLVDIAPDWRHPVFGTTARRLLAALEDQGRVEHLDAALL